MSRRSWSVPRGRLIAHSNPGGRLGTDLAGLPQVAGMIKAEPVNFGKDADGHSVLTAAAFIPRMNWYVFFEQPLNQALQPVYNLLFERRAFGRGHPARGARRHFAGAPIGHARSRPCRPAPSNWRPVISAIASSFIPAMRSRNSPTSSTGWRVNCTDPIAGSSKKSPNAPPISPSRSTN